MLKSADCGSPISSFYKLFWGNMSFALFDAKTYVLHCYVAKPANSPF
jgi:hypothetical protein